MNTAEQVKRVVNGLFQSLGTEPSRVSDLIRKGGPGSGFFGHAGRQGEVGGSSPEGGGAGERPQTGGGGGGSGEGGGGPDYKSMHIGEIAQKIRRDWGAKVNFAAKPYLEAMMALDSINDNYGMDSGQSIVAYFLSNASSWRGETAKAVKAELNRRLKG